MKLFKSNYAVSHLIGYTLTLSLTAIIATATILSTNNIIEDKKRDAAQLYAESIADRVSDAIINVCLVKEQYPNANYSTMIDLPRDLVGYSYYIKATNDTIFVNSTNGLITATSPTYNVSSRMGIDIDDRAYGSYGALNISCWPFNYTYKFDFGTENSSGTKGYTRVTDRSTYEYNDWRRFHDKGDDGDGGSDDDDYWGYMRIINISNPTDEPLTNYQILIQLTDTNFNYDNVNCNGTDIRFLRENRENEEEPYWIERWNPSDTHTSRIWVKVREIPPDGCNITMYYGNSGISQRLQRDKHDPTDVFVFFDNFTGGEVLKTNPNSNKWEAAYTPNSGSELYIKNNLLVMTNGSALRCKDNIMVGETPCITEAKAKTIGENTREASMFVRNDGNDPPYENGYILESGNFSDDQGYNLSLIRYYSGSKQVLNYSTAEPVDEEWYRLTYILNNSDHVACRYFYSNYTLDGYASASDSTYPLDGQFGLCAKKDDTIAYFDWIYVRNYTANTDDEVSSRDEAIPVAKVGGEIADNNNLDRGYKWDDVQKVKSVERQGGTIHCDFVSNSSQNFAIRSNQFNIRNLGNEVYGVALTLGDKDNILENLKVTLSTDGGNGDDDVTISGINCNPYKKIWISNFLADGNLNVKFDDDDNIASIDYYWAVSELILQKGQRKIHLSGGR